MLASQDNAAGAVRTVSCRITRSLDQAGAAHSATGPGVSAELLSEGTLIQEARSTTDQVRRDPSSSLPIVQLAATASVAALRAVACDRLRRPLTPAATDQDLGTCDELAGLRLYQCGAA